MLLIPPDYSDQQARHERARIVATAQGLYLERGVGLVALANVAFALRIPVAAVERQFPEGRLALLRLVLESHLRYIHENLEQLRDACRNAVEALLAMRRFMQQQMSGSRSLLLPELEALDPALWRHTQRTRLLFMRKYLRANLQQGMQEGLCHADLDVKSRVRQWLSQVDARLLAAPTPPRSRGAVLQPPERAAGGHHHPGGGLCGAAPARGPALLLAARAGQRPGNHARRCIFAANLLFSYASRPRYPRPAQGKRIDSF